MESGHGAARMTWDKKKVQSLTREVQKEKKKKYESGWIFSWDGEGLANLQLGDDC